MNEFFVVKYLEYPMNKGHWCIPSVYQHDSLPLRHASFKVFLEKYLDSRTMDSMVYGSKVLFARVGKRKLPMNM